jgi:hypothetical protein
VITTLGFEPGCISGVRVKQFKGLDRTMYGDEALTCQVGRPDDSIAGLGVALGRTLRVELAANLKDLLVRRQC